MERGFNFDPTANLAINHVTRQEKHPEMDDGSRVTSNHGSCHASPEDVARFTNGFVFEPTRVISNRQLRRALRKAEYQRRIVESKIQEDGNIFDFRKIY